MRPALSHYTIYLEGRVHALEHVGAQIIVYKVTLHELLRRSADGHGIGGCECLDARRNVRGLAHGELLTSAACSHLPYHDWTSVEPHADGQSHTVLLLRAGAECSHGLDHRQTGPHGASSSCASG